MSTTRKPAARFTKGDRVILAEVWSRGIDGASPVFSYRAATVTACGQKRMTLVDAETGALIGRDFDPKTTAVHATDDAAGFALTRCREYIAAEIERTENRIAAWGHIVDYRASRERDLANLRRAEPQVVEHNAACAEVRRRVEEARA